MPFGGGSGAGVTINPIAFLVIQENNVKLMPVNHTSSLDKLLDYMPDLMEKASNALNQCLQSKMQNNKSNNEEKEKNINIKKKEKIEKEPERDNI